MEELKNLDWREIVLRLSQFATSEIGRNGLSQISPLKNQDEAILQFAQIAETSALTVDGLRPHMQSLDLFSPWHQRLVRNAVLKTLEIKDVRHFCLEALALKEILENYQTTYLKKIKSNILPADEPLSAIDQIMTAGGEIRSDASETLHHLNVEKTGLARQVQITLDRLVKDFQIEHLLQERYVTTREGRWVLPIKSGMQHGFEGIVHASSQSKQTVFMEPQEVVPINNRLREIEIEIEQEIERLLQELSKYLSSLCFQFEESKNTLAEFDQTLAKSQLMVQLKANACQFSNESIYLKNLKHPLLAISNKDVITNDIDLNNLSRILLLSGPNAGGKTVLLKAVGLAGQMARCGLPICADANSKLPFFKNIVVALGDSQSVDANLSTFAAHLKSLERAANCKNSDSLILIDEICGSTDPEEGAALARSFIDTYIENSVFGIITSHLGALKLGWSAVKGIVNGSLEFDKQSGPTYRFIMGVPGQSLAIQTAKRVGVDQAIVKRALSYLSPEQRVYQSGIDEIEKMKHDVLNLQDLLNKEIKAVKNDKIKYENLLKKFEQEKEALLEKEIRTANKKIDEMIQESKVKDVFRKHEDLQKIKYEMPKIIKHSDAESSTQAFSQSSIQSRITTAEEFAKAYPPGSSVHVQSLSRDGIVQGLPNSRGEVLILANSMRLQLSWQDLTPALQSQNPTQNILRKSGKFSYSPADSDRIVDLRGLTIEDAISQLEIQLDAASLGSEDRIKIVHGHGTDTLKRSVRSYLSRSVYVKKWAAGNAETGGDGVTWAELK